ncbi:tyrosine-type recombinase/integrase [Streptomyces lydicus]|uniref:tyrosine-type recombinase/integrase n=1 Tax=Streptomyces lydicus TaxID=47763 RepID=UPI002E37B1C4|nr:tyrosine-type recombinase/integrase [Streptomyces lydicus]
MTSIFQNCKAGEKNQKASADTCAAKTERGNELGVHAVREGLRIPLVRVFEEFISAGDTVTGSKRNYEASLNRNIKPYFGDQDLGSVNPADIQGWLTWMREQGYEDSTTVVRYRVLSSVFNYAVNRGYIARNPCHRVRVKQAKALRRSKKRIQIPTLDEVGRLTAELPEQLQLLAWLMCGCGLRIAEALAVTSGQFDVEEGVLYVDRQIVADGESEEPRTRTQRAHTRGRDRALRIRHLKWRDSDEGREVPLSSFVGRKVQEHIKRHGTFRIEEGRNRMTGDYLFTNISRTNIMSLAYMDKVWGAAVKAAELGRSVKKHWLRHFFASAALSRGVPVSEVAEWLGHTDPKVTYGMYAHLMPEAPARLRSVMDSIFEEGGDPGPPLETERLGEAEGCEV